jgi:glycosyltransferase involved in cell wall biosynthesis
VTAAPLSKNTPSLSIILPAKDEADSLRQLLPALRRLYPGAELVVVNDGSTDETKSVCAQHEVKVVTHPYTIGNGAAVKTGARVATGEVLIFMDADGQHNPDDIQPMLQKMEEGYDMVVGARGWRTQAGMRRAIGNSLYNRFASWMTGFKIEDLTSGFRAVRADKFRKFLYLLPNGFSYPTTITMAFFRSAFPVAYVPINAGVRHGKSKLNLIKDGTRFFIIILKIGALFSPMRLFLPVSFSLFLAGLSHYSYTYLSFGRFTNMSALLFISSLLTFLIGIVSEQVSSLHYRGTDESSQRGMD